MSALDVVDVVDVLADGTYRAFLGEITLVVDELCAHVRSDGMSVLRIGGLPKSTFPSGWDAAFSHEPLDALLPTRTPFALSSAWMRGLPYVLRLRS